MACCEGFYVHTHASLLRCQMKRLSHFKENSIWGKNAYYFFFQVVLNSRKKNEIMLLLPKPSREPAVGTATQGWAQEGRTLRGVCERSNAPGLGLLPARHALSFRLLPAGFAVR